MLQNRLDHQLMDVTTDNTTNRRIQKDQLSQWRMNAVVLDSGLAALAALQSGIEAEEPIDLMLLDAPMLELDGFEVLERIAGDPELRKVLAVMFLDDCPELLSKIRNAVTQQDGPSLKLAAHTLKGSAGVFKVQQAFDAALRMEHVGRDCDWDHAEEAWISVNKEMVSLSAMLTNLMNSAASAASAIGSDRR